MVDNKTKYSEILEILRYKCDQNPHEQLSSLKDELLELGIKNIENYLETRYYEGCSAMYQEDFKTVEAIGHVILNLSDVSESALGAAYGHNLSGIAAFNMGNNAKALYHYKLGYDVCKHESMGRMEIVFLMNLCWIYRQLKAFEAFDEAMSECLKLLKRQNYPRMVFKTLLIQAWRYLDVGNVTLVEVILNKVKEYLPFTENNIDLFYYHLVLHGFYGRCHELNKAFDHLKRAEAMIEPIPMQRLRVLLHEAFYEYYAGLDMRDKALGHLVKMTEASSLLGNPYYIKKSMKVKGLYYEAIGQYDQACQSYRAYLEDETGETSSLPFSTAMLERKLNRDLLDDMIQKNKALEEDKKAYDHLVAMVKKGVPALMRHCDFTPLMDIITTTLSREVQLLDLAVLIIDEKKATHALMYQWGHGLDLSQELIQKWCAKLKDVLEGDSYFIDPSPLTNRKHWLIPCAVDRGQHLVMAIAYQGELTSKLYDLGSIMVAKGLLHRLNRDQFMPLKTQKPVNDNEAYLMSLAQKCGLTKREVEIIQNLSHGNTNQVIAGHLNISENTVKNHMNNIFKKMCINNRYELISYFHEQIIPKQFC